MSQTQSLFSAQCKAKSISVTATASSSTALPSSGNTLRVCNTGSSWAYFSVGTGAQTATVPSGTAAATATPIGPGVDATFSIPNTNNTTMTAPGGTVIGDTFPAATPLNISAICGGSDTTTLVVQVGEGI